MNWGEGVLGNVEGAARRLRGNSWNAGNAGPVTTIRINKALSIIWDFREVELRRELAC